MCVTSIYVDVYPDGQRQEFRTTSPCQWGLPGRPCAKTSTLENPIRKIQWGETTTEFMLTQGQRAFPQTFPQTPPRSPGGSRRRQSGGYSSNDDGSRRRSNKLRPEPVRRATREHRKERIVIVDSPPTPRTPPQAYNQPVTAPNSPATRGRPIIVDERPRPQMRVPSVEAVVGHRRPYSRPRTNWESPSSSHTSFNLHVYSDEEQRRRIDRDERIAELEAEKRRASFIAAQDEEIRRRPVVPIASPRLRNRPILRPILDQTPLHDRVVVSERTLAAEAEARRRRDERERATRLRIEAEDEEAMKQRLRERQLPSRRFSVGPASRRPRVFYSDGVYRWE